jgi:lipoate-protein ligase A
MATLRLLDLTLDTPEANLALEEALLDWCQAGGSRGVGFLRFWRPASHFVVLGYGNRAAVELDVEACRAAQVPVLRRCTGGGAVLQGPGCLNYALVLPVDSVPGLETITAANRLIMQRHARALAPLLETSPAAARPGKPPSRASGVPPESLIGSEEQPGPLSGGTPELRPSPAALAVAGHTDLTLGGLKCSGNAQRRKHGWLLFHGSFLLDFDLPLMETLLRPPSREPDYRHRRSHAEFLTRLPLTAEAIQEALRLAWDAAPAAVGPPPELVARLVRDKYSRPEWNLKF